MHELMFGLTASQICFLLFAAIGCLWATPHLFMGAGMRESSRRISPTSYRTYDTSYRTARVSALVLTAGMALTAVWVLVRILSLA